MRSIALALALAATGVSAADFVNGYFKRDGTYVQPHYRSSPDSTRLNNYSTQGNVNPYTGQQGTRDPYTPQGPYDTLPPPTPRHNILDSDIFR